MAGVAVKHLVDGQYKTVTEMAKALGVKPQALYSQMSNRGISLQVVVNLIRENQILNGQATGQRFMVNGKWLTKRQAAEALDISRSALNDYMAHHGCTLQEAMDAYREDRVKHGGRRAIKHRVGHKTMSVIEAAEKLCVSVNAVHLYMSKHKCSLAATIRHYEQRKRKKAEKDILAILMEGKR